MLAGPRVSRLLPFLQEKGFVGDAFANGKQALEHLRGSPCHVLCIEIEVGDMMGVDLARIGKDEGLVGATLLLEDPIKSGMVISALARGIEAFVPVPPDEKLLLDRLEALLLAQWGLVVSQQQEQQTQELARARLELDQAGKKAQQAEEVFRELTQSASRDLADERRKVAELESEIASLRDQLATMHLLVGAKTGNTDEGLSTRSGEGRRVSGSNIPAGDFDDEITLKRQAVVRNEPTTRPQQALPDVDDAPTPHLPRAAARPVKKDGSPGQSAEALPKARKSPATTAKLDVGMLRELAGIPKSGEEEIIFVEDD